MTTLDDVLDLFERWGSEHYDEDIAQLDHARQVAALAEAAGAPPALIAAALLHDVGHLLDLRGDAPGAHERSGPAFLAPLFPDTVLAPIRLHVEAKRYLCAVDPGYTTLLSAGSTASLRRQGGPMDPADRVRFEATPGSEEAVRLRRWDDAGKQPDMAVPPLAHFERLLRQLARPPS